MRVNFLINGSRRGSALVLVLAILVVCLGLAGGMHQRLVARSLSLEREATALELRAALTMGLREGMERWSADESPWREADSASRHFETGEGVEVEVTLRDAQDRFNLNHLTLPVTPDQPRSALDMLEDLLRTTDPEAPPEIFHRFRETVEQEEPWFSGVDSLELLEPAAREWRGLRESVVALPPPRGRGLTVNVNTARPEVLHAMLGDAFRPWVQSLLLAREREPIRNLDSYLRLLPEVVRRPVDRALDVRSSHAELRAAAEYRGTRRTLTAWLRRETNGEVEVLRCRW